MPVTIEHNALRLCKYALAFCERNRRESSRSQLCYGKRYLLKGRLNVRRVTLAFITTH